MIYGKKQFNPDGWWNDNRFVAFLCVTIFCIIFLVVGFSIKFGCRKIVSVISEYNANAPQRETDKRRARELKSARKLARDYKSGEVKPKAAPNPVVKAPVVKNEPAAKKSIWRKEIPTFEEYKAEHGNAYTEDHELLADWEREHGDLMFDVYGELVDPCPGDAYTAEQNYWILALALWGVFVIWAGVGTGGNPIAIFIACLIGLLGSIVVFCW